MTREVKHYSARSPWSARRHVALVSEISKWLTRAGVKQRGIRSDISVDLSDGLFAALTIRNELAALLACDPQTERGRDKALSHAANITIYAEGELTDHLERLVKRWRRVENALLKPKRKKRGK
jgi:hypothetical protein